MIQITFVGAGSSTYKTPIGNTLTAEGYTPTVDGDKYTITFAEPVDSFSVSSFTAQVRMSSIIVTTLIDQSTADTPVEISFDLNYDGATGAPGNAAVMVGSSYGPLPEVSREGFVFGGWFTNAGCTGEAVTEETIVTRAHTLYAKWMADVSFHLNYDGADDAPENTAVAEGSTYGTLPTVSREGYIFGGWFTDIGCTGTAVKATDVIRESHTLYAKWTEAVEGKISEITIDFSTTDQRTGYSTEQQVWTNGALTFTNDKDTSTTNVGDFSDPVRLYKDSSVTIACAGMTQIVIVSNGTSDYKANLTGSLDAAGVTYTTSDDTYTIILAEPADTFSFSLSVGQARFESIAVIVPASSGETPDPTPDSTIVESWGLTLKDEVVVKFKMTFTPEILADEAAYVEVKVGSTTMNVPVSQVTGPIQVPVMASQMTEKITLCIVDGNGVSSEADSFTVRQYCDTILGNEEYAEYHQLVKEMLNYGSTAQLYFGNNTGDLAGQGITDVGQQAVPTTGGEYTFEDQIEGLDCRGATLVHRDKIGLRYYFNGSLSNCTFSVTGANGKTVVNVEGGYVEITDILPQNLNEDVTLTVTDVQGKTISVKYRPMNYIIRMSQKGESKTKELVKALYNYHLAAKAFSDNQAA